MYPEERKKEYDELFDLMAEEFDYLASCSSFGDTISRSDIERWAEFNRRINKLKAEAMS